MKAGVSRLAVFLLAACGVLGAVEAAAQPSPTITGLALTSTPATGSAYGVGETITATITFSASNVNTNQACWRDLGWGTIWLAVEIGAVTRSMRCSVGQPSGNNPLVRTIAFTYTVQADDLDLDGISIRDGALQGGQIFVASPGAGALIRTIPSTIEIVNPLAHKVDARPDIASTNPSPLSWATLHGATLAVELPGSTFATSTAASHFTLGVTAASPVSGLTVASVVATSTMATLTLSYTGSTTRSDAATLAVTVAAAAHSANVILTTRPVPISLPGVLASPARLSLTEGGSGAYDVALNLQPAAPVMVTATSDNPQIAVDSDATPLTRTLTFTPQDWDTAQTVTVRALADADAVDEVATITNVAASFTSVSASVRVSVDDDEETGTDHDLDNDGLIDVDSLAKLNAVRWDLDGDGTPLSSTSTYRTAFPSPAPDMGCPDGPDADQLADACAGYELTADLDFDTNGSGDVDASDAYPNWSPIGGTYSATFDGNNRVISNLTIVDAAGSAGLFNTVSGTVRGLGLADVDVSGVGGSATYVAPLVAVLNGSVVASWASGRVRAGSTGLPHVGGLVGRVSGTGSRLAASYSTASVTGANSSATYAGGLAGAISSGTTVVACYATGLVDNGGSNGQAGGLIGNNVGPTTVRASYFAGTVASSTVSGVTSANDGSGENYHNVYYDSSTTGLTAGSTAQTTSALQGPTSATGTLYAAWDDLDVNGNGSADEDPWDFGSAWNYPALKYGGLDPTDQRNDYDADGDRLIDIATLSQLNAVRSDVDGDGVPPPSATSSYFGAGAFPNGVFNPSGVSFCWPTEDDPRDNCAGYELVADLDFDTDGDGDVDMNDEISSWTPIADWAGLLDGGGHMIKNLTVSGAGNDRGLFATATTAATVRSLGLVDVSVTGPGVRLGALAGVFNGRVAAVYATGSVTGAGGVGGLVAETRSSSARIVASYSRVDVQCTANANWAHNGGLAARNDGVIAASYAAGAITGNCPATVKGGLVSNSPGTEPSSYWDTDLTTIGDDTDSPPQPPEGKTSAVLQAPTSYDTLVGDPGEAIYAAWDDQDVDGDGETGDGEDADPWDFGGANEHPILKYGGLAAAPQLDAQPDTAPVFATSTPVAAMTFPGGVAIQPFQLPAVTGGNGAHVYTPSGLPAGLSLGVPNCATASTVCGAPTVATSTTVTVTVDDSDSNMAAGDRDTVTFMVTVPAASARIASTTPPALMETNLNGAGVVVELSGTVFGASVSPSGFQLATTPTIAGLSIASATRDSATRATLRLRFDGTNFNTRSTLAVRVLAAAHRFGGDQDTGTVAVAPAVGVMLSATDLALQEASGSNVGTYTVVLTGQPAGAVTVTPTSGNSDVTVGGALTFNAMNWNTARTVTVTAGQDDDAVDDVAFITHAVQGIPGVASGPRVRVAVNDDDSQGLTLATSTLAAGVTEGMTGTYTARLASEPTGVVAVAIASSDGAVTVDVDATAGGEQATLLFNAANWDTPQTVTVRAGEDDDGEGETVTLTHDPSGADYGAVTDVDVSFTVTDDDTKGATLSASTLNVQENGTATYTLVLDTEPVGGPVSVAVASSATSTATASPPALTFTAENWDVPQTVTVAGVDDANTTDDGSTVSHTATGADYGSVAIGSVAVTVRDDEQAGLKVSPTSLTVEEGATATYTVRLNTAPAGAVTVVVGGATAKLTVDQTTLSFGTANWDTAQTVTATAVADADGDDETVALWHGVAGTGDYATVALAAARIPGVEVRVEDGETAGVVVAPTSLTIAEGATAEYTVRLSAPPASGTSTVAVAATGMAGLTVATSSLVFNATSTLLFTGTNWNTAQTVTVTAVADHDRLTDSAATLTHAATNYGAVMAGPDVPVTVRNTTVDHDADADGLIEIDSLAKLDAIRWDLDGDGTPAAGATSTAAHAAAFPNPRGGAVCPTAVSGVACRGYELTADLDFDTDGDGRTWTETGGVVSGDAGDDYDNGGAGWDPIGVLTDPFTADFNGNGRVVRNLFVNDLAGDYRGLFGIVDGRVAATGLADALVRGDVAVGALAGWALASARVTGNWSTGSVSGDRQVGGLLGQTATGARVAASYSTAAVECGDATAGHAGGLAGGGSGTTTVATSWSAGAVTGACPDKAGLVGGGVAATASYWDATASGVPDDADLDAPEGLSTAELKRPTDYEGVYAAWNIDLDGDGGPDDPWHFGTSSQYPSLKWRGFDVTEQFAGVLAFASGVSGKSFAVGRSIASFQVPAAAGGRGTVRYSARGLPPGLWFDGDGRGNCGLPRSVCGTPSEEGRWSVSVTARDADGTTAALTFPVEVVADGDVDAEAGPPAAIADEALREAVARALGRDGGTVTEGDLRSLEELDASWSGVSSLSGLSLATNLRRLVLGGNALSDLSELSGLRLLAHLDLSDNAVSDLSALSGLTRLETLLLSGNRVSDLSPLRGMAELKALVLDGNAVSDLAHMVFLESLEELSLSGNPLEGLSPLCSLRELKWLWLAGSGLSDISELSCLSGLERLWLSDNAVEDVGPLSGMRRLAWLDLERNAVSGVDALRRLEALSRLRLGSNRVSDAGPLAANEGLGEGDVAGLRGNPLSEESIRRHVPALRERGVSVLAGLSSPWFASAGDAAGRQSFVRLVNRSEVAGEALMWGVDDAGARFGPARLSIGAGRAAHFNSEDLELGNAAKGLTDGVGAPVAGDWRLEILSTLDLEAQTFLRVPGGPLSALHDGLPRVGETLRAAFLPAGRERSPSGALRVSNPTGADETVMAWGFDDAGRGRLATGLVAPAGRAVTVSASELERWRLGAGRGLGRGEGNWRLELAAPWPLEAQALAVGDGGRIGNLSGAAAALGPGVVARVPLFPPASATGRVGVARVWNLGAAAGEVLVTAVDDAGVSAGPVSLALEAFAAAEFDSRELEEGGGPLARGVGVPTRGSWRLELRAQFGARVHARAVGAGGYATGLLKAAPRSGGAARVSMFNPGSNRAQRSLLRLANDGAEDVSATIEGVDDAGRAGGTVSVTVPAGEALWLSASELEQGGDGFEGSLGDGEGKWRLTVSSSAPLAVMSLVEDEQGALSNLSTPGRR